MTLENPEFWLSGSSDFTYKYYSRSYNSGSTDLNDSTSVSIKKYDVSDTQKAALALSQPVSIQYMNVTYRNGNAGTTTTTHYDETFHWYAEDWTCNLPVGYDPALIFILQDNGTFGVKASAVANTVTEIVIPETYKGQKVTTIVEKGFENLTNLETITLPNTITNLQPSAFSGCTNLTFSIPESVKTIGPYALNNIKSFTVLGNNNWSANVIRSSWNTTGSYVTSSSTVSSTCALTPSTYDKKFVISRWADGYVSTSEDRVNATWTRKS